MLRGKARELARRYVPAPVKRLAGRALASREGRRPALEGRGVIEDLCYWTVDDRVDTVLPLQNYFSVLYPDLATATEGTLHVFDAAGRRVGARDFAMPGHELVKLRMSDVLRELRGSPAAGDGTLLCDIKVPPAVLATLDPAQPFYFWDRFYIAYQPVGGIPCFVHGVDKSYVVDAGASDFVPFYPEPRRYTWVPETPVDLTLYARFSVVLVNRTEAPATVTLAVRDARDRERRWSARVAGRGAHRFAITAEDAAGLDALDLRLRVDGIPTRWGRPVVMKEFRNGAISAMHC